MKRRELALPGMQCRRWILKRKNRIHSEGKQENWSLLPPGKRIPWFLPLPLGFPPQGRHGTMEDFSGASHDVVIITFSAVVKSIINREPFPRPCQSEGKDILFADPRMGKYGGFATCSLSSGFSEPGKWLPARWRCRLRPQKPRQQPQWQSPSRLISLKPQVSYFTPSFSFGLSFCLDCVYSISHKMKEGLK